MSLDRAIRRLAWIASRAICGEHLNGEVDRIDDDDAKRAIKQALDLPLAERKKRVDQWLGNMLPEDANEIRQAMLQCDPRGADPDAVANLGDLAGQLGEIEWEWHGWFAKGFVTLLAAEQDSGKSLFALWAIARSILLGETWPDGQWPDHNPKSKVLWCEAEAAQQLLLERAGKAKLPFNRIIFPTADPFATIKLDNPAHVAELRETVKIHKPRIIVYDALSGGHDKRENSSDEMIPVVRALSDLARDFKIAVLLIHHVNKLIEAGEISMRSIRGASGITQLCRAVWALEKLDDLGWLRLRAIKLNIAKKPEPIGVRILDDRLEYGAAPKPKPKHSETAIGIAKRFLQKALASGPRKAADLYDEADNEGISEKTLKRAKSEIGIKADKQGFEGGAWYWSLAGEEGHSSDTDANTDGPLREF